MVHVQFRCDRDRVRRLDALVESTAQSRSELLREALDLLGAKYGPATSEVSASQPGLIRLDGWDAIPSPTAAGLPVADPLDDIA